MIFLKHLLFENGKVVNIKSIKFLYHVTPSYNVESILRKGLIPSSENKLKLHKKAVYFVTSEIDAWNIAFQLNKSLVKLKKVRHATDFSILKIDVSIIPNNVTFYEDLDSIRERGILTYDAIPPKCIFKHEEIKADQILNKNYTKEKLKRFYPSDYNFRYNK